MTSGFIIHPEELTDSMLHILEKSRPDVLGLHPVGGIGAENSLDKLLELIKTRDFQTKLEKVRSLGIKVEYELHALSWLIDRKLFAGHTDWFRFGKDGRTPDFHMCVSNQAALDYLSERAEKLAKLLPSDTGRYHFWVDDTADGACECEKCAEFSSSDQALIIYNAILRGVKRFDMNATECYLAYHSTLSVPTKIRPDDGIYLEFAPMSRDTKRKLDAPDCEVNKNELSNIKPLLGFFGKKGAQVLEYQIDNSLFSGWKKPPKKLKIEPDAIKSDLKLYEKLGFSMVTSFGCFLSDDYINLWGEPPIKEYLDCFR